MVDNGGNSDYSDHSDHSDHSDQWCDTVTAPSTTLPTIFGVYGKGVRADNRQPL
jgi:hypothetical protein